MQWVCFVASTFVSNFVFFFSVDCTHTVALTLSANLYCARGRGHYVATLCLEFMALGRVSRHLGVILTPDGTLEMVNTVLGRVEKVVCSGRGVTLLPDSRGVLIA